MIVVQTKVVAAELVRTGQIQDLLKVWVEGVRQRRDKSYSEDSCLSNWKERGAINQEEKCSSRVDLGDIRNSLLGMLSLRC